MFAESVVVNAAVARQEVGRPWLRIQRRRPDRGDAPLSVPRTVSGVRLHAPFLIVSQRSPSTCGPPGRGAAHLLRHSLATSMLRHGASLQEVAAILRHRSIETTQIYAKVDVAALRKIAQPWPEMQPC